MNVPYYEWNKVETNEEEKKKYLAAKLAAVGWSPGMQKARAAPAKGPTADAASPAHGTEEQADEELARPLPQAENFGNLSAGDKLALLRHKGGTSKQKLLLDRAMRRKP